MNILLIDTCLNRTYLTIKKNDEIYSLVLENEGKDYHTSHIHSNIIKLCQKSNLSLQDINLLAADIGPGSFTGIKVGLTIVKTIAQALDIQIVPINSLELLLRAYKTDCCALDARKDKCYFLNNSSSGNVPELIDWNELKNYHNKTFICDKKIYDYLINEKAKVQNYEDGNINLSEIMLSFVSEKETVNWANLKPLYIQPPPIHKSN